MILSEPSIDLHGVAASRQVVKRRRSISVFSSQIHLLLLKEGRRDGVQLAGKCNLFSLPSLAAAMEGGLFFANVMLFFQTLFAAQRNLVPLRTLVVQRVRDGVTPFGIETTEVTC